MPFMMFGIQPKLLVGFVMITHLLSMNSFVDHCWSFVLSILTVVFAVLTYVAYEFPCFVFGNFVCLLGLIFYGIEYIFFILVVTCHPIRLHRSNSATCLSCMFCTYLVPTRYLL